MLQVLYLRVLESLESWSQESRIQRQERWLVPLMSISHQRDINNSMSLQMKEVSSFSNILNWWRELSMPTTNHLNALLQGTGKLKWRLQEVMGSHPLTKLAMSFDRKPPSNSLLEFLLLSIPKKLLKTLKRSWPLIPHTMLKLRFLILSLGVAGMPLFSLIIWTEQSITQVIKYSNQKLWRWEKEDQFH